MNITDAQHERALYLDLEWNCWDGPPVPGRFQEIIEIGVVEVNLVTLEVTGEKDYLIRPRPLDVSAKCTSITGLTAADLKSAPPFPAVLSQFEEDFRPKEKLCCTWGTDAQVLASACSRHRVLDPLRNRLDVSQLFWHSFLLREQPSLRKAIEIAGLPFDGIAHTALGDARNTARVHAEIIRRIRHELSPAGKVATVPDTYLPALRDDAVVTEQALRTEPFSSFSPENRMSFPSSRARDCGRSTSGGPCLGSQTANPFR